MKLIKLFSIYVGLIFTVLIAIIIAVVATLYGFQIPQNQVKAMVVRDISKMLKQPISVDKISGNLITSTTISGLKIYNRDGLFEDGVAIEIDQLTSHYNIIDALFKHHLDFSAATSRITINKINVNILRNKDDLWNFLHILPPHDPNVAPAPPTFRGKIKIADLNIRFTDQIGWQNTIQHTPFQATFNALEGIIDFKNLEAVDIQLNTRQIAQQNSIKLNGSMSNLTGQYQFNFSVKNLDLNQWGPYAFIVPNHTLEKNTIDVNGHIRSKNPFPKHSMPFWYDLQVHFHNSQLTMPYFSEKLSNISGTAQLQYGQFNASHFQKIAPEESEEILHILKNNHILDAHGQVIIAWPIHQNDSLNIPEKYKFMEKQLIDILNTPRSNAIITTMNATLGQVPLSGTGNFDLNHHTMALQVQTHPFDVSALKRLFNGIRNWKISGKATSQFTINGAVDKPLIQGQLHAQQLSIYAFDPTQVQLNYRYQDGHLQLENPQATLYKGTIQGTAELHILPDQTQLQAHFTGTHLHVTDALPQLEQCSGTFNITIQLSGTSADFDGTLHIPTSSVTIFNQHISAMAVPFHVSNNEDIRIYPSTIVLNKSNAPLTITGNIENLEDMTLYYTTKATALRDFDTQNTATGHATLHGTLSAKLDSVFWKHPYKRSIWQLQGKLEKYPLYGSTYKTIQLDFIYDKENLTLHQLSANTEDGNLKAYGQFQNLTPRELTLELNQFDPSSSTLFNTKIPQILQPFDGAITGKINLKQRQRPIKDSTWNWMDTYLIDGELTLENGHIQNQFIKNFHTQFKYNGQQIIFSDTHITQDNSKLALSGYMNTKGQLLLNIKEGSHIDLKDFNILLSPYGNFYGSLQANGNIYGTVHTPNFALNISAKSIQSDFINIDKLTGFLSLDNHKMIGREVHIHQGSAHYELNGFLDLIPRNPNNPLSPFNANYDLNIIVHNASLNALSNLIESGFKEYRIRKQNNYQPVNEKVANANMSIGFSSEDHIPLYTHSNTSSTIRYFKSVNDTYQKAINPPDIGLANILYGNIKGQLHTTSREDKTPKITSNFTITNAQINNLLNANSIQGTIEYKDNKTLYSLQINNGTIGHIPFQTIQSTGDLDDQGILTIAQTQFSKDKQNQYSILSGKIPVSDYWTNTTPYKPLSLDITLKENDIGLLTIISSVIDDIQNEGEVALHIGGTLETPIINSKKIELTNAKIYINRDSMFKTPFKLNDSGIRIQNNRLIFPANTQITYQGIDTQQKGSLVKIKNTLNGSGDITIQDLNLLKPKKVKLAMNLKLNDTVLTVNYPQVFIGELTLKNMSISGNYSIPISEIEKQHWNEIVSTPKETGPVISGQVTLTTGDIILPSIGPREYKPSFELLMDVHVKKDITISGSLLGEGLIAGFATDFNLPLLETNAPLKITGTLNNPIIQNSVEFGEGSMRFLNKEFVLQSQQRQFIFFKDDQNKAHPNTLRFGTLIEEKNNKSRLSPIFNITALTVLDPRVSPGVTQNIDEIPVTEEDTKYKYILITLDGPIYNLEKLTFYKYTGSKIIPQSGDIQYQNAFTYYTNPASGVDNQSETQQLAELLVPEFQGGNANQRSAVTEFGENAINSLFRRQIRPLERQLADTIGIYDLRVDYNVGRALSSNLANNQDTLPGSNPVGLNLMTKVFSSDKLFLRVRTDWDSSESQTNTNAFQLSEIELTYYLMKNLSLNYANIRDQVNQNNTLRPRFSLQYSLNY